MLRNEQRLGSRVINRAAEQLAARFNSERIALAIAATLHGPDLVALRERLQDARLRATEALSTLNLSHVPTRQELLAEAKVMFAKTRSLEEIIDHAYDIFADICGHAIDSCKRAVGDGPSTCPPLHVLTLVPRTSRLHRSKSRHPSASTWAGSPGLSNRQTAAIVLKWLVKSGGSGHAPDSIVATADASALSHDCPRCAFGHVVWTDADALQARPPPNGR